MLYLCVTYFAESRKPSRWDTSKQEKKEDSIGEFLSLARSKAGPLKQESSPSVKREEEKAPESPPNKVFGGSVCPLPLSGLMPSRHVVADCLCDGAVYLIL